MAFPGLKADPWILKGRWATGQLGQKIQKEVKKRSKGTSSAEQCEHNVESLALNVMEQDQSEEEISLFLED